VSRSSRRSTGREFHRDSVVSAGPINSFKSRLDEFCSMHEHDFAYDYTADPLVPDVKCNSNITVYLKF